MSELGYAKIRLIEKILKENFDLDDPTKKSFSYKELLHVIQEFTTLEGSPYLLGTKLTRRGHKIFKEFTKYLFYRNIANYDSMLVLSSLKGGGKSSAAIMLAREWCNLLGIRFDPKKHICYNNADVMRAIDTLPKFHPIVADESYRFAAAAEWAKKENKELKRKLAEIRTKHHLFIMCWPMKLTKMEGNFLHSFVNYYIELYDRGKGCIFVRDMNPIADPWKFKSFEKLGSYNEFTTSAIVEKKLSKHPNFWNIIRFPKPPRWLYERYLQIREKNVYDDDNILASVAQEDIHRALMILAIRDIMVQDEQFSINRIIMHINNEYNIKLQKKEILNLIEDAKQLYMKITEAAIKKDDK